MCGWTSEHPHSDQTAQLCGMPQCYRQMLQFLNYYSDEHDSCALFEIIKIITAHASCLIMLHLSSRCLYDVVTFVKLMIIMHVHCLTVLHRRSQRIHIMSLYLPYNCCAYILLDYVVLIYCKASYSLSYIDDAMHAHSMTVLPKLCSSPH